MNYFNDLIMEYLVILIMLIALFLLYRIAYPKQSVGKKENEVLPEKPKSLPDVMGKSRFVLPSRSQPLPTPATSQVSEQEKEKSLTFAAANTENRQKVIPSEQLDEVFADKPNEVNYDDELDIEIDDDEESNEVEIDLEAEEAEELARGLGQETIYADGVDFNDLQEVAKVIHEQPETVSEKTAKTIVALEDTEMLERLVANDTGRKNWVELVVARSMQKTMPEAETSHTHTTKYDDFVGDFLV